MARIMNDIITVPTGDTEMRGGEPEGRLYESVVKNN